MRVRLVVVKGRPEGAEILLPSALFLIGRDPECHLRPNSDLVSKRHCAIVQRRDGVFVRDLKSTNGTFVNNDRIGEDVRLNDGDLLRVGPLVFAVKIPVTAGAPSQDEEDQAASWLLDYSAGTNQRVDDLGTKTTIMDTGTEVPPEEKPKPVPDTKVDPTAAPHPDEKVRRATAELASDLLDKLLQPPRRKKR